MEPQTLKPILTCSLFIGFRGVGRATMRMVLSHMEFLLEASTQAGDKGTEGGWV